MASPAIALAGPVLVPLNLHTITHPFSLNTDERVNSMINALLEARYVTTDVAANINVDHMMLQCARSGCLMSHTIETNKCHGYKNVLVHALMHRWNAGAIMANACMATGNQQVRLAGGDPTVPRSSPPKRIRKRPSADSSSPIRSTSSVMSPRSSIDQCMAIMLAGSRLPLHWLTLSHVTDWLAAMGSTYSPTLLQVTAAVKKYGQETKQTVVEHLVKLRKPVTVATDSVTNVNHHKIYSVVLHCDGASWYYCSWNIVYRTDSSEDAAAQADASGPAAPSGGVML